MPSRRTPRGGLLTAVRERAAPGRQNCPAAAAAAVHDAAPRALDEMPAPLRHCLETGGNGGPSRSPRRPAPRTGLP
ncbi:hypothetical protein ABZZ36_10110 [Actinacidiphila glaucinigra]|uniref:hypothetical protein n=1 Tax=Actinacidiphila glaucinigra TaxID=235986 RepID=UPI0033B97D62